jgi:hypothetical protein
MIIWNTKVFSKNYFKRPFKHLKEVKGDVGGKGDFHPFLKKSRLGGGRGRESFINSKKKNGRKIN